MSFEDLVRVSVSHWWLMLIDTSSFIKGFVLCQKYVMYEILFCMRSLYVILISDESTISVKWDFVWLHWGLRLARPANCRENVIDNS